MESFKKLAIWIAALAFTAVVLLSGIFSVFVEKEDLRARVERDINGYQLRVRGNVGLSFIGPALVWNDLVLRDPENRIILQAKKLLLSASIPEFFSKKKGVKLRLKGISVPGFDLGDIVMAAHQSEEGSWILFPIEGKISGGKVSGRVFLDGETGQPVLISGQVRGFDYKELDKNVSGEMDVDIDLTASAGEGWLQSLSGKVEMTGGPGIWPSDIDFWITDVSLKLLPFGDRIEETKLNCFVTRSSIDAGFAQIPMILIDSERATITGAGRIDLAQGILDIRLVPRPKNPSLFSLATPVTVRGPLTAPVVTPEAEGVVKKLGSFALGAINPALFLLPLGSAGSADKNPCVAALEKAE